MKLKDINKLSYDELIELFFDELYKQWKKWYESKRFNNNSIFLSSSKHAI